MNKIEPYNSWLPLEERAASETNPRHKKLLTEVRDHMENEIKGQLEPLMATLTEEPIYHFWGDNPSIIKGYDAIKSFYSSMFQTGGQQFEVVLDRIVVDDGAVITEGQVKNLQRGSGLKAMGITEIEGESVEDDHLFVTTAQLVTVWPADKNAKLVGEDIYFGENSINNIERVEQKDLPDYYVI